MASALQGEAGAQEEQYASGDLLQPAPHPGPGQHPLHTEEDRKAGLYSTPEGRDRFRRQHAETEQENAELGDRPVVESGWQVVPTEDRLADAWERWTPEQRGSWLRDSGVHVDISRPAVKRARVPLAERTEVDWGSLADLYLE